MKLSSLAIPSLVAIASLISGACYASPLTPEAALSRAMGDKGHKNMPSRTAKDYSLVYTEPRTNSDEAAVYVFATGEKGYMILSADDVAYPVLGYSDQQFDESAMSLGWLKEYARQISATDSDIPAADNYPFVDYERIEPMIKTHWGNGTIYRDKTPLIDGKNSHPGDLAVAMAQIMNYHKYPSVGQGQNTYSSKGETLSYDFSTLKLDWDSMLPKYDESCTDAQKSAIAELIYACGVAANMQYDTKESTTSLEKAALGLVKHFGYDKGINVDCCTYYTLQTWNEMVYKRLVEDGPIIYHFYNYRNNPFYSYYICDGYDGEGLFHFNADLGGKNDGYYRLSALSQKSWIDFSDHCIISNIYPAREDSQAMCNLGLRQNLNFSPLSGPTMKIGSLILVGSALTNHGVEPVTGMPVIEFTSPEGQRSYAYVYPKENHTINPGENIGSYKIRIPEVADGQYDIAFKFQTEDGNLHPIKHNLSDSQIFGTVTDKTLDITYESEAIIIADVYPQGDISWEDEFFVDARIRSLTPRPIEKQLYLCAYNTKCGRLAAWCDPITVNIDTDEEAMYMTLYPKFTHFIESQCGDGEYYIQFVDPQTIDREVSPYGNCNIHSGKCPDPLKINTFRFLGDRWNADPTNLEIKLSVKNLSGIHDLKSDLVLVLSDDKYIYMIDNSCFGDDTKLMPLQEYEKTIDISRLGAEAGKSYYIMLAKQHDDEITVIRSIPVTMATSGIEDVTVDGGEAEYYNMQGVRVDKPSHGYYIKRTGTKATKVYVQ